MATRGTREERTAELHRILTTKQANRGAVGRIAAMRRLADSTVYDYLYGKIIADVDFIIDAFLATEDPEIRAMLEPEGWTLRPSQGTAEATADIEREIGDVNLAISALHAHLRQSLGDRRMSPEELDRAERLLDILERQAADIRRLLAHARANHGRVGDER